MPKNKSVPEDEVIKSIRLLRAYRRTKTELFQTEPFREEKQPLKP